MANKIEAQLNRNDEMSRAKIIYLYKLHKNGVSILKTLETDSPTRQYVEENRERLLSEIRNTDGGFEVALQAARRIRKHENSRK